MAKKQSKPKRDKRYIDFMAQDWLYKANIARERGDKELEQRHLARAQVWLDRLNEIDGLA